MGVEYFIEIQVPTEGIIVFIILNDALGFIQWTLAFYFKGLVAVGERAQKRSGNFSAAMKDLSGEHTFKFPLVPSPTWIHNLLPQTVEIINKLFFFSLQANILCLLWWKSVIREGGNHQNFSWSMIVALIIANIFSLG